jgi:hypothetical protein
MIVFSYREIFVEIYLKAEWGFILCRGYFWCLGDVVMFIVLNINNISLRGKFCRRQYETIRSRERIKMMFDECIV